MIILYILCITYFIAINFYAFLLIKSYKNEEKETYAEEQSKTLPPNNVAQNSRRALGKLLIAGALGGAITIYICMFLFKYRRENLLLMPLMPLLGVLNLYLLILLFRFGFGVLVVR